MKIYVGGLPYTTTEEQLAQIFSTYGKVTSSKIIIDREKAEIYVLAEKTGLNIPYFIAMAVVYILFFYFIYLIWKRSKRKHSEK